MCDRSQVSDMASAGGNASDQDDDDVAAAAAAGSDEGDDGDRPSGGGLVVPVPLDRQGAAAEGFSKRGKRGGLNLMSTSPK
jgi:hypothetical protein